jgi:hypothetical protein
MPERRAGLNAFSPEFLQALRERDEPGTSAEVESRPPLVLHESVDESGSRFSLFRAWRSFEAGDVPEATFENREDALIFLAARGTLSRSPSYRFGTSGSGTNDLGTNQGGLPDEGFAVERAGGSAGWLRTFDPEWLLNANAVAAMARSSEDLAMVVLLSGPSRQEEIGEILARSILPRPES